MASVELPARRRLAEAIGRIGPVRLPVTRAQLLAEGHPAGAARRPAIRRTRDAIVDGELSAEDALEFALDTVAVSRAAGGRRDERAGCLRLCARYATVGVVALAAVPAFGGGRRPPRRPVVERFLTMRDREVRTSLFCNGIVVVSGRRDGERIFFRQIHARRRRVHRLSHRTRARLRKSSSTRRAADGDRDPGDTGTVTLYVGPKAPLKFSYSSMAIYDLTTTRLSGDPRRPRISTSVGGSPPAPGSKVGSLRSATWSSCERGPGHGRRDAHGRHAHARARVTHIHEIVPRASRKQSIFEVAGRRAMRITGGEWRSRKLKGPGSGSPMRPTPDALRERTFAVLGDRIVGLGCSTCLRAPGRSVSSRCPGAPPRWCSSNDTGRRSGSSRPTATLCAESTPTSTHPAPTGADAVELLAARRAVPARVGRPAVRVVARGARGADCRL